jgi:hypothetical protein
MLLFLCMCVAHVLIPLYTIFNISFKNPLSSGGKVFFVTANFRLIPSMKENVDVFVGSSVSFHRNV